MTRIQRQRPFDELCELRESNLNALRGFDVICPSTGEILEVRAIGDESSCELSAERSPHWPLPEPDSE